MNSILLRINTAVQNLRQTLLFTFGRGFPPDALCLAGVEINKTAQNESTPFSLKDLLGNGYLWAVPKHRRSVEKRWKRKYGDPNYVLKLLTPRKDLRTCNVCGDDHQAGVLCPTCYRKVINETKEMQEQIQNELQLEPVEKEVVVLYDGEKDEKPEEFFKGKRIVEMKKARPSWFSKNLLQETTQKNATTKEVKPSELG
ncbi:39S ribosomal protein L32, mitochondrial [Diorhabda sublineata]|uniref:39S ribosomal protein L32, mitochondrial n=1 Tax=Diorhabda sublineata TaxID=1163346 RepID=UPI0024E13CDA|nr:39S ribosomal protein L32, mitochondrial [Diorhabda sublineata]